MCRNLLKCCALLLALCLTAGCAAEQTAEAQLIQTEAEAVQPKLAQADMGSVARSTQGVLSCEAYYRQDVKLTCADAAGMVLRERLVENGEIVTEGQALARFCLPEDAERREALETAVRQAELRLEASRARAEGTLAAAKLKADSLSADTPAGKAAAYQLEKAYYALENLDESQLTAAREALAEYEQAVAGIELTAPFAGTVEQLLRVSDDPVTAETELCRLYTQDDVYLRAESVNEPAFRMDSEVTVLLKGAVHCKGTVCSCAEVFGTVSADLIVRPEEGADCSGFFERNPGLTLKAVRLQVDDVLRLPKKAVRSEEGKYYVYLYDGMLHKRYVQIGLDGVDPVTGEAFTQILEGIRVGDQVSLS